VICRIEKSPHLLLDFSDALQVNVYILGKTFLQLIRLLNLQEKLKIVDPVLFIPRFASRFELGALLPNVVDTSQRIVARMKRDWVVTGRHPDGICAAAMFIASRCHGVELTLEEVSKVFRVSLPTLKLRLQEFQSTPAAQLTVRQLSDSSVVLEDVIRQLGYNVESNPPSFIRNNQLSKSDADDFKIDDDDGDVVVNKNDNVDTARRFGDFEFFLLFL